MSNELGKIIDRNFPLVRDCMDGAKVDHQGPIVVTLQWEQTDEDRQEVGAIPRCSHCWLPDYSDMPAGQSLVDNFNKEKYAHLA